MNTVETLKHDDTLLVSVRPVAGGKIQFELAQHVINPNREASVISLLNASDERFQRGKPRRSWLSAEPADAKKYFPEITEEIEQAVALGKEAASKGMQPKSVQPIMINLLNPVIAGKRLFIEVRESTTSELEMEYSMESTLESRRTTIEWLHENIETQAKRAGADGEYLFHNGENIISEAIIVAKDSPDHSFKEITGRSKYLDGRDLGTKQSLAEKEEVEKQATEIGSL